MDNHHITYCSSWSIAKFCKTIISLLIYCSVCMSLLEGRDSSCWLLLSFVIVSDSSRLYLIYFSSPQNRDWLFQTVHCLGKVKSVLPFVVLFQHFCVARYLITIGGELTTFFSRRPQNRQAANAAEIVSLSK